MSVGCMWLFHSHFVRAFQERLGLLVTVWVWVWALGVCVCVGVYTTKFHCFIKPEVLNLHINYCLKMR